MKELKFRAWDKHRGKNGMMLINHNFASISATGLANLEGLIWMQYTGLKDKNGKEIYEGDILASPHFKDAAGREHTLKHIVQWSSKFHGWFLLNCNSMDEDDGSIQMWIAKHGVVEIIGNIYENRELLK